MYTSCPGCKIVYRVTVKQLRTGRGEMFCQDCHIIFNALNTLSETLSGADAHGIERSNPPMLTLKDAVSSSYETELVEKNDPEETPKAAFFFEGLAFGLGSVTLIVALFFQLALFEGAKMAQNPWLRPSINQICEKLGCKLPDFIALERIKIAEKTLRPLNEEAEGYEFKLVFTNQAALDQALPNFMLVLTDAEGNPIAERLFKPHDYLNDKETKLLAVGKPMEIRLLLAKPSKTVAGFKFKFS